MSTIQSKSENVKNAVKWISEARTSGKKDIETIIQEASLRFNLSPKEAEFIQEFIKKT